MNNVLEPVLHIPNNWDKNDTPERKVAISTADIHVPI
jgi:hypothetical protein